MSLEAMGKGRVPLGFRGAQFENHWLIS